MKRPDWCVRFIQAPTAPVGCKYRPRVRCSQSRSLSSAIPVTDRTCRILGFSRNGASEATMPLNGASHGR